MKPYEHDDAVYRRLESEGKTSWDEQADPDASFENFVLRPFLEETIALIGGSRRSRALEIGCGTGPASCYLASKGLVVDGIDISPHAIAMARQQAALRGLQIRYVIADVCEMPSGFGPYDLIVDGHCIHCLARDADRQQALAAIRSLLKHDGMFVAETMVSHDALVIGEQYRLDTDGVLWLRVDVPSEYGEPVQMEGAWYLPHRRILRPERVLKELADAGFRVMYHAAVEQYDRTKPQLLRVRCVRSKDVNE